MRASTEFRSIPARIPHPAAMVMGHATEFAFLLFV
jgi:hypothetical protein